MRFTRREIESIVLDAHAGIERGCIPRIVDAIMKEVVENE